MAGVTLEIVADTATPAIDRAARGLSGADRTLMLSDIGEYVERATRERAAQEIAPDGTPWTALSPRYKAYKSKRRPAAGILRLDNHMLRDELTHQVDGDTVAVGTRVKYGAVHQFGATITPKKGPALVFEGLDGLVFAKRVTVPARPWLGLSAEDETEVLAIARDHLAGLFAIRS